ncbi:hypothetical protein AB0I89_32120 [Micromonospora sp. NPDC049801]|uniref:hypothetical protein n=1 Tax=unclassified Micromonospora TaxID=2617518 RepID=UPI0033D8C4E4
MSTEAVPVTVVVDADFPGDPGLTVCAIVESAPGGVRYGGLIRPDLDRVAFEQAVEFIGSRIARFIQHGPEPDGWEPAVDGVWRLWARLTPMPTLD